MSALQARAETIKLARLLDTGHAELKFLHDHPAEDTRAFREAVSDSLFDEHRHGFARLAKLSGLLPAGIAAKLSEQALGPMLSARVAGELPPDRAVVLARKLSTDFLAQLCLELEPVRAGPVIAAMPESIVVDVAMDMLAMHEYIAMARFVDVLPDETLAAVIAATDSDEALLRIGFFVENDRRLDQVIGLLPADRLAGTVQAAADSALWSEALGLIERVGRNTQIELARLFVRQDDDALEELVDAAETQDLWPDVVALYACLPASDQAERGARAAQGSATHYGKLRNAAERLGRTEALAAMDAAYRNPRASASPEQT